MHKVKASKENDAEAAERNHVSLDQKKPVENVMVSNSCFRREVVLKVFLFTRFD